MNINNDKISNPELERSLKRASTATSQGVDDATVLTEDWPIAEVRPIPVANPYFNRECRRYAKKHKCTLEEAMQKVYK